eukprot:Tbor_TRINITY_DN5817_c1_g1::TRINITY_DN5817_c1_g1_i3::g.6646::m.6646
MMTLSAFRTIMMTVVLSFTIAGLLTPFATSKTISKFGGIARPCNSSFQFQKAQVNGVEIDFSELEKYTFCGAVTFNKFLYTFTFAVIAIVFNILTIVVLLISTCVFRVKGMHRTINVIMPVITCVFLIMATGCAFIYPSAEIDKCHTKLSDIFPDITPGLSTLMLLIATILCFITCIFSAIFDIMIWGLGKFSNGPLQKIEETDLYNRGRAYDFSPKITTRLLPSPIPDPILIDASKIETVNNKIKERRGKTSKERPKIISL